MIPVAALALAAGVAMPRFFLMGEGTVALSNAHTGETTSVSYRREDGSYDAAALAKIRHVMHSRDGGEGTIALRLVELLGWLYALRGQQPLTIQSGYRSPDYNDALRAQGRKAAGGSLHTEGLAADVAFPRRELRDLWMKVRALDCCGAGYYQSNGFLHVDVGRPRFWDAATSKVEQNLSTGNALLFARTEYDRYAMGEPIVVTLHALTAPPVLVAKEATLTGGEHDRTVRVEADLPEREGCFEVAEREVRLRVADVAAVERARLVLRTCAPRVEKTPATVQTNPIEVRRPDTSSRASGGREAPSLDGTRERGAAGR